MIETARSGPLPPGESEPNIAGLERLPAQKMAGNDFLCHGAM
jgi:hypothetical protein